MIIVLILLCLLAPATTVNFPYQISSLNLFNSNNMSWINSTYYMVFAKSTNPIILTSINNMFINSSFTGYVTTSISTSNPAYDMVTITFNSSAWNSSVSVFYLNVAVVPASPNILQSYYFNVTALSQNFTINTYWNSTNSIITTYLLGWQNIVNSKSTVCYIPSAGILTCNNSKYNSSTSAFLYYNVVIYSSVWLYTNCPYCVVGNINSTTSYKPLYVADTVNNYNYFCGFSYFGYATEWVGCIQLPTQIALGSGTSLYDSGLQILSFPGVTVIPQINTNKGLSPSQPSQIPLIVGLTVGLTSLVAIVIIAFCYYRKQAYKRQTQRLKQQNELNRKRILEEYRDKIPELRLKFEQAQTLECCLCLQASGQVTLVPCKHNAFCVKCIEWSLSVVNQCPICRRPVDTVLKNYEDFNNENQNIEQSARNFVQESGDRLREPSGRQKLQQVQLGVIPPKLYQHQQQQLVNRHVIEENDNQIVEPKHIEEHNQSEQFEVNNQQPQIDNHKKEDKGENAQNPLKAESQVYQFDDMNIE